MKSRPRTRNHLPEHVKVSSSENYEDLTGSEVVVIAAGAAQNPGETRLIWQKIRVSQDIIPGVVRFGPDSVVIIVSNPVDVLTYRAYQLAGFLRAECLGLALHLIRPASVSLVRISEDPPSIHAYIPRAWRQLFPGDLNGHGRRPL